MSAAIEAIDAVAEAIASMDASTRAEQPIAVAVIAVRAIELAGLTIKAATDDV